MNNETIGIQVCLCSVRVVLLSACLLACGCRMVSNVESAGDALGQSTSDLESISQTITNTMPTLEQANRTLQEAASTIATVTPSIVEAKTALEEATAAIDESVASLAVAKASIHESEGSIKASTESIVGITVAVDEGTVAIGRLCRTLETLQGGLDRLSARKGLLVIGVVFCVLLVLIPPVAFLILLWKLKGILGIRKESERE